MFLAFQRPILRVIASAAAFAPIAGHAQEQVSPVDPLQAPALDPDSPLAPLPDLGVEWPDLASPADATAATAPAEIEAAGERRYRVTISGADGLTGISREGLQARFDAVSTLAQGEKKPANVAQIDRRAREDEDVLRELMRSFGYYDAGVRARVENGDDRMIRVTMEVEPGPVYRFASVDAGGIAAAGDKAPQLREAFPVKANDIVNADTVNAAEANLRTKLGREGFAFGTVAEPQVVVDHETRTATLTMAVDPGTTRKFGKFDIRGPHPLFSAKHLGIIARFKEGDPYDALLIDDFRRALIATSLVSAVKLTPVPGATPDVVDLGVALERAPPRTVAGQLGYGTGEGYRAELSWEHRNLIPTEGAVTVRGVVGTQEQSLGTQLRRNNFRMRDQVLTAQIVASHTNRDAYDAKTFTVASGIERQTNIIWQKKRTWSFGGELTASDERDVIGATAINRRRTFFIAAVPTSLSYDGTDDLLNPTRGYRLAGRLSPELSLQGNVFAYAKMQIDGSAYLPVRGRTVIAGRIRLGSIAGATSDRIAPSRRFYSGGGGSVRGYGYQRIGPLDVDNDPIGGSSLAEFGLEARVRFGDFGVVPFLDGGNLYSETLPRFTGLRYGAGLGVRYYTSFGPIRVDVGTPLNRRPGDSRVGVYVSLGQAF